MEAKAGEYTCFFISYWASGSTSRRKSSIICDRIAFMINGLIATLSAPSFFTFHIQTAVGIHEVDHGWKSVDFAPSSENTVTMPIRGSS